MFQKLKQFLKLFADKRSPKVSAVTVRESSCPVERIAPTRIVYSSREMQPTNETINLGGNDCPVFHQFGNRRLPHVLVGDTFLPLNQFSLSLKK